MCRIGEVSRAFQALGHETRLRLVVLLTQHASGPGCSVAELARTLSAPASAISLHLGVLESVGVVRRQEGDGPSRYSLDRESLLACGDLARDLLEVDFG